MTTSKGVVRREVRMAPEPDDSICWTGVMEENELALGLLMTLVGGWYMAHGVHVGPGRIR